MSDLRKFVDDRLTAMHDRPHLWSWSKEAFALQVMLLVEIVSGDIKNRDLLSKFFQGTCVSNDHIDEAWARSVVEIARKELP